MLKFLKNRWVRRVRKSPQAALKNKAEYKALPKTLNELDDSYRMVIRELSKR